VRFSYHLTREELETVVFRSAGFSLRRDVSHQEELCEQGIALDATANQVLLLTVKALMTRARSLAVDYISEITVELPKLHGKCGVDPP
jgi:hypothetical protein